MKIVFNAWQHTKPVYGFSWKREYDGTRPLFVFHLELGRWSVTVPSITRVGP